MLRKYRVHMIVVLVILVTVTVFTLTGCEKSLPQNVKDEIKQEFEKYDFCGRMFGVTWYDECGTWDAMGTFRYMGTYGDCYAFLVYTPAGTVAPENGKFVVHALPSAVYFPAPYNMQIVLYHTKQDYAIKDIYRENTYKSFIHYDGDARCHYLNPDFLKNPGEWLTDSQWEQLTRDVQKIAESFE